MLEALLFVLRIPKMYYGKFLALRYAILKAFNPKHNNATRIVIKRIIEESIEVKQELEVPQSISRGPEIITRLHPNHITVGEGITHLGINLYNPYRSYVLEMN